MKQSGGITVLEARYVQGLSHCVKPLKHAGELAEEKISYCPDRFVLVCLVVLIIVRQVDWLTKINQHRARTLVRGASENFFLQEIHHICQSLLGSWFCNVALMSANESDHSRQFPG